MCASEQVNLANLFDVCYNGHAAFKEAATLMHVCLTEESSVYWLELLTYAEPMATLTVGPDHSCSALLHLLHLDKLMYSNS